jgi:hypothetical protein
MTTLNFDGIDDYIEIADDARLSVATTGRLTVAAWMRPDVLAFPNFESTGYVRWLGKGEIGQQEWTFRMYNQTTNDIPPRPNRISGFLKRTRAYSGIITPEHGVAPLRIGTRDLNSFFLGAIREVQIWSRALEPLEVKMVAEDSIPQEGLAAEYRLDQDIALDSINFHHGQAFGGSWESSEP